MKLISVVLFVAFVALSNAHHTPEHTENIDVAKKECLASTGASEAAVDEAKKGNFADDEKLKEFFFCVGKKIGYVDEAGAYQVDAIKHQILAGHGNEEEAETLSKGCTQTAGSSPQESSFLLAKCLDEKSEHHFNLI
ncbi:PREDICTED: B2 protein-like [Nicrophorus vespilloides]|uniref:B2 protein-like n=1 Tax=Nicrophorus vespilloides TaxID=110193 RepID=A0ABM1N890_NICVS|nr:PREDICTED: B2 protein-like [Nicrophorus vespilloides]